MIGLCRMVRVTSSFSLRLRSGGRGGRRKARRKGNKDGRKSRRNSSNRACALPMLLGIAQGRTNPGTLRLTSDMMKVDKRTSLCLPIFKVRMSGATRTLGEKKENRTGSSATIPLL